MCFMEQEILTTPANEVWRPIAGYEGLYEVSSLGRVRSLDRVITRLSRWGTESTLKVKGVILQPNNHTNGYQTVLLSNKGCCVGFLVHRLVAKAFVPNPDNLPEVNHKDECKKNNRADNLEWCDRVYNVNYGDARIKHSAKTSRRIEQLTLDGKHVAFYDSQKRAIEQNGYSNGGMDWALKNTNNTAYGYKWRYV